MGRKSKVMQNNKAKRLIEVAMPVKEISAESVRDKSIRHGHISTLHLWWARRPLPVCRAVVFASLVPDPLDENCPEQFREAVKSLLASPEYKPYSDIPWTSIYDPMEDNLRTRLLMFIGRFSDLFCKNEKQGKNTEAKDLLSDGSLIKWDNKNNPEIIQLARKLIWVSYNADSGKSFKELAKDFDKAFAAIQSAENDLYTIVDRHLKSQRAENAEQLLNQAIEKFQAKMPAVFDPFAGGGAIPLEAARLGCRSFGNDINPVAFVIQKGSLEFPQKYGKPITYSKKAFIAKYGEAELKRYSEEAGLAAADSIEIKNRLAFDVDFYCRKLLEITKEKAGQYYPGDSDGKTPVAYYWTRVAKCANPSCGADVPLLKQFYLCDKPQKRVFLNPIINGKNIDFEIKPGRCEIEGWNSRGNLNCPICANITPISEVKRQFKACETKEKLIAVIKESEGGKSYELPTAQDLKNGMVSCDNKLRPKEKMIIGNNRNFNTPGWGIDSWGQMFTNRQLLFINNMIENLSQLKKQLNHDSDYSKAVIHYLVILIDRLIVINTSFGRWHVGRETMEHPFARQAIPMIFDFPESNPFCSSTGSAANQISWLVRYIESEGNTPFFSTCCNSSSGERTQFEEKFIDAVVTDPPYYDAIAYADLSDFFYIWLKKTLGDVYPLNFAFPLTPKSDECTALKHHHQGSLDKAKQHFEKKLLEIFTSLAAQTGGVISIMFAHQSTEAWTTLCNSILKADMNIFSSWPFDSELGNRMIAMNKMALGSSVTVSCKKVNKEPYGSFKKIREHIFKMISEQVESLYNLGFRGADLLTACFGKAVREFGLYDSVEKSDGSEVTVAELLELTRDAAFNAIISDIDTDSYTRFYIGWLHMFGFSEAEHDDVRRITQIGLNVDVDQLLKKKILINNGNKENLADMRTRCYEFKNLGQNQDSAMIDRVQKAMQLFTGTNRAQLLGFIKKFAIEPEGIFWRVINSLVETLPSDTIDYKAATGLANVKENLIKEARAIKEEVIETRDLHFGESE